MQIKITPLSNKHSHTEDIFRIKNYYYLAKFHSAGIVTEVKKSDKWLENEMSWVSRSEIPFLTAFRQSQFLEPRLVRNSLVPVIRQFMPFYELITVDKFPSDEECMQLVYKYCEFACDGGYIFSQESIDKESIKELIEAFDYRNNLMVRAGSCLYKAYVLLETSHTFAEEIYTNTFIALEAIIEILKTKYNFSGRDSRSKTVDKIAEYLKTENPGSDFKDYEEEMREGIRNNIIHPYRSNSGEKIDQPFMMADYVYEDLSYVDWIFKQLIKGKL